MGNEFTVLLQYDCSKEQINKRKAVPKLLIVVLPWVTDHLSLCRHGELLSEIMLLSPVSISGVMV